MPMARGRRWRNLMSLMLNESVVSKNQIIISISRMICFRQLLARMFMMALATTLTSCSTPRAIQISAAPAIADERTYLAGVCAELSKSWPANRTVNIVCHGHSVPAGYAKTPAVQTFDAYQFLLHRGLNERFPHAVVNLIVTAIGGEKSRQGAPRVDR